MIISHKYQHAPLTNEMGGKGSNLLLLKQKGYPVPNFVIIPTSLFERGNIDKAVEQLIPELLQHFKPGTVFAVRSSATAEDGKEFSFAGQFATVLDVDASKLKDAIMKVWRSAQTDSLQAYLKHTGVTQIGMAVIVQEMIPATVAGVAFGVNPLTGNTAEQVINIVAGSGEKLVSGDATADSYVITNKTIKPKNIADEPLLTDAQLLKISDTLDQLAETFGAPQDIEFALVGEAFYLLQSRPVTTTGKSKQKIIWDNSNIIESYPGITLPLTFSFIEKMYGAVYRQLSGVLGISAGKVQKYSSAYDNMLGQLNGRVYYNLNSWYKVLSLLPGYKVNAEFMEKMMGVKEKPDIDVSEGNGKAGIGDYIYILKAVLHILYNLFTVKKQKKEFIADFDAIYNQFRTKDYNKQGLQEIWYDYSSFEQLMLAKWKAPLVNDLFAMIYFGVLQKMCAQIAPEHKDIHNHLVASSKDIITTEPIKLLPELAVIIAANVSLKEVFTDMQPREVWRVLQQPLYRTELIAVQSYIDKWGERTVAELKLETVTYTQEPERLIAVLQMYIANNISYTENENNNRSDAYTIIQEKLKGKFFKRLLFGHVLNKARYLVSNRENLRYYRTKGFGMVRKMMTAFGQVLAVENIIGHSKDVFYLELEEVEALAKDTIPPHTVKKLIAQRKKDHVLHESLPLPERVITYGKQELILAAVEHKKDQDKLLELQGIPCSAGVVKARVRKVVSIDNAFPQGSIMATYATDPGYVVMFPASTGILTERGSLLSHAAIVSREMGIPCIVGIPDLMEQVQDGDEIIMDGSTGIVKILSRA